MSPYSLTQLIDWIKEQSEMHEQLSLHLGQAQALAYVPVAWMDFLEDPKHALWYLEALHDLIRRIVEQHQILLEVIINMHHQLTFK